MPLLLRTVIDDQTRYSIPQLLELRRQMLRFAKSLPAGPERYQATDRGFSAYPLHQQAMARQSYGGGFGRKS